MKIIDLFMKKANGEETPKRFRYDEQTYIKNSYGAYKDEDGDDLIQNICRDFSNLNDEIEILEEVEDKEYEDIEELDVALLGQCDNWLRCPTNEVTKQDIELNPYIIDNVRENTLEFQRKINALIRNQKYILERLNNDKRHHNL